MVAAAREVPGFQDVTEEEVLELQATDMSNPPGDIMDTVAMEDSLLEQRQQQWGGERQEEEESALPVSQISAILAAGDVFKECVIANENSNMHRVEFAISEKAAVLLQ